MTHSIDQTLHQVLTLLLIWTLLQILTFYPIVRGFHGTFATGAACQQRTLTPPDTWSCPTFGLASVLMLRPVSPELVVFPDFWVSNIPWYFCFASNAHKQYEMRTRERAGMEEISTIIRKRRWKWIWHVLRMEKNKLFSSMPEGYER